jgi:hypothetical protein
MSRPFKAAFSTAILTILLAGCGNKESEVKKPVEPALPEPKTGADIDAAAEEAMLAAEKAVDAEVEAAGSAKSEVSKTETAKSDSVKTQDDAKVEASKSDSKKAE